MKEDNSILLIQSDVTKRNALSSRLRTQGYKVENASDGFHALNLIETKKFGLGILSTRIDNMPPFECMTLIRDYCSKTQLPIIVLVDKRTQEEDLVKTISAGANACVLESNNVSRLMKKIEELCVSCKS